MDNLNFEDLHKAVKKLAPEKADAVLQKYESVYGELNSRLLEKTNSDLKQAKDYIDTSKDFLIRESANPKGVSSDRIELVESFTRELDLINTTFNLTTDRPGLEPQLEEKYVKNGFFLDEYGQLKRKGFDGTYEELKDGTLIYTRPDGIQAELKANGDFDNDWRLIEISFPQNLWNQGFHVSKQLLKRQGYDGVYELKKDGSLFYTWKNGGKSKLAPGADINSDWQALDDKAKQSVIELYKAKGLNPPKFDAPKVNAGFGEKHESSQLKELLNEFAAEEKQDMLAAITEQAELSENQRNRRQQVAMLKLALETIRTDINTEGRTWGEDLTQLFEFEGTTNARVHRINNMILHLDEVDEKIVKDPNITLNKLVESDVIDLLREYNLSEDSGALIDENGNIKDATTFVDLQTQYIDVISFLRNRKDYASAQKLIENTLLAPYFEQKRSEIAEVEKNRIVNIATSRIDQSINQYENQVQWRKMSPQDQQFWRNYLIETETTRRLNKVVSEMNNGLPFEVSGFEYRIMSMYKDMMGTGEWHNFSDSTWDSIVDEVVINVPLIMASGAAGLAARAALSAGARALIGAGRFGLAVARTAQGVEAVTATGNLGKMLYWGGRTGGLIAEGLLFETTFAGLQGKNLFEGGFANFPEWGKKILWTAATLGTVRITSEMGTKIVNPLITKYITKIPDSSVRAVIQKLLVVGNMEVASLLFVGALQHYEEFRDFEDWHLVDKLLHAYFSLGALKIAGKSIEIGAKKFVPEMKKASEVEFVDALRIVDGKLEVKHFGEAFAIIETLKNFGYEIVQSGEAITAIKNGKNIQLTGLKFSPDVLAKANEFCERKTRAENPEKIAADELQNLAVKSPELFEAIIQKIQNLDLTHKEIMGIFEAQRKAGIEVNKNTVFDLLLKSPDTLKLANSFNIRALIDRVSGFFEEGAIRQNVQKFLSSNLKPGSAMAGLMVLLYSPKAYAADFHIFGMGIGSFATLIPFIYIGVRAALRFGLKYSVAHKIDALLKKKTHGELISATNDALRYAASGKTGRLPESKQNRSGSPMEVDLSAAESRMRNINGNDLARELTKNTLMSNYIKTLLSWEQELSPEQAGEVRAYRVRVETAVIELRDYLQNNNKPAKNEVLNRIRSLERAVAGDRPQALPTPLKNNPVFWRWMIDLSSWIFMLEVIGIINLIPPYGKSDGDTPSAPTQYEETDKKNEEDRKENNGKDAIRKSKKLRKQNLD